MLSPLGAGTLFIIAAKISSIPRPVFALAGITSSARQPSKSTISSVTSAGLALGKSTLFKIGIISRSFSSAKYRFEIVCAWMLCAASTTNKAPSQAAIDLETSYEKSTCPGVSIRFKTKSSPS